MAWKCKQTARQRVTDKPMATDVSNHMGIQYSTSMYQNSDIYKTDPLSNLNLGSEKVNTFGSKEDIQERRHIFWLSSWLLQRTDVYLYIQKHKFLITSTDDSTLGVHWGSTAHCQITKINTQTPPIMLLGEKVWFWEWLIQAPVNEPLKYLILSLSWFL